MRPSSITKLAGVDSDLVRVQEHLLAGLNPILRRTLADLRPIAPTLAAAPGDPGQIAVDATSMYFCVAPATWVRLPLVVFGGSGPTCGIGQLVSGEATIPTTAVKADSIVLATKRAHDTSINGQLVVHADDIVPGTSFFVHSINAAGATINDTSPFSWLVLNHF